MNRSAYGARRVAQLFRQFVVGSPLTGAVWARASALAYATKLRSEERIVFPVCQARDEERELHRVVVAPHAGFATRNLAARRHVVPAVRAVIDAVQQEALVLLVGGE